MVFVGGGAIFSGLMSIADTRVSEGSPPGCAAAGSANLAIVNCHCCAGRSVFTLTELNRSNPLRLRHIMTDRQINILKKRAIIGTVDLCISNSYL